MSETRPPWNQGPYYKSDVHCGGGVSATFHPFDAPITHEYAALTVRAVNCHEQLVAALEALLEDTQHAEHDCGDTVENCAVLQARVALSAARQGEGRK